jgi:hypothetical protein
MFSLHLFDNQQQIVEVDEIAHLRFQSKMNFESIDNQLNLHPLQRITKFHRKKKELSY